MEYSKPKYILFAGVNGSGKSTLFRLHSRYQDLARINIDEIVREYGDWRDTSNQVKAGRKAVRLLKEYLENTVTFNQETTLCGRSILKNIEKAKSLGYFIEMHYIGVESADICKERIKQRVLHGGHGISDEDVDRRYAESLANIKKILPFCDKTYFYDNTENFTLIAIVDGTGIDQRCKDIPKWFKNILCETK